MQLTPREFDKLLIYMMAEVAQKRLAQGIKLNYPEAVAIISAKALDGARVVVIGAAAADALFPGEDPAGQRVRLGRIDLTVIGTLVRQGGSPLEGNPDNVAAIRCTTGLLSRVVISTSSSSPGWSSPAAVGSSAPSWRKPRCPP